MDLGEFKNKINDKYSKKDNFILLVEDNEDDIILTIRALKKGHILNRIVVVKDGQEAIDFLFCQGFYNNRDKKDIPILILLDLKLPKLEGVEVLKAIKSDEVTKLIPVVVLTTSNEERDILNCYGCGVNSYIKKPVDFEQFSEVVKQIGLYWLLLNISPLNKNF